ncbi:MAG: response regulator [Candidatus Scalindua sp.]|jgi:putative nucleotidyltransferase with HDIG domain|nr:response regulator [Candidatus Scalindua sp.]MBT5306431.1 response regulator [Candidatus Scalindua sp.]MBT6053188.1 response regulator [Candidatus Scalindua sp.]MBT6229747.1 response regulator [Candidatus Scalindua sp.]MBT6564355.1 response regulator [Candidatus Scalindua sp.]
MKILIVDDNKENLYILETLLRGSGYDITSALNGADAMEMLWNVNDVDMIISDILMPVMDGFQLCKKVKSNDNFKHIPVVFYTGTFTDNKDEELAIKLGVDKYIRKPIRADKLESIIQEMLKSIDDGTLKTRELSLEEDKMVYTLYNERLVEKLEHKVLELENETIERKEAEERTKYLATFPQLTINPILEINQSGEIVFHNNAASNILEKSGLKENLHIYVPENINEIFYDLKSGKKASLCCDVKIGDLILEENIHYVSTFNVLRIYTRDITERKQSEQQIKLGIEKLKLTVDGVINALTLTVEYRDPYTAGHQQRVSNLACVIAREIGLPKDQVEGIRIAGVLHDIGKMHIPTEILSRPGKLNENEFNIVKSHAQAGYDILKGLEFPWPIADIVHQHHEKIDGSGYPFGLPSGDIIIEARILCVADVVEAMASHRPYRPSLSMDKTLKEISENKGVCYDREVVDACMKVIKEKKFVFEQLRSF